MFHRRTQRALPWLMALAVTLATSPAPILFASEPTCRMGCANTSKCCCRPVAKDRQTNHTTLEQRSDGETCPDQCAVFAAANPIGVATNSVARDVSVDTDARTALPFEDRLVPGLTGVDADPRAPPISL